MVFFLLKHTEVFKATDIEACNFIQITVTVTKIVPFTQNQIWWIHSLKQNKITANCNVSTQTIQCITRPFNLCSWVHKNSTIKGLDYPNLNPSRCGSPILIWGREYFVQSSDNAHSDPASDRFKFIAGWDFICQRRWPKFLEI